MEVSRPIALDGKGPGRGDTRTWARGIDLVSGSRGVGMLGEEDVGFGIWALERKGRWCAEGSELLRLGEKGGIWIEGL